MKLLLLFSVFLTTILFSAYAQIATVGIIGTATPGGWDSDTDMVQHPDSAHLWTLSIDLVDGLAKFRADDAWTINWGSTSFPLGVAHMTSPLIRIQVNTIL